MPNIGILEIVFIAIVIILLFGGNKIPEIARKIVEFFKNFLKRLGVGKDK